jgi:hypothetical protein
MTRWGDAEADYNLRQLKLAKSALDTYLRSERRVGDLGSLVGMLDGLNAALESPDEEWRGQFEDQLLTLESAYAVHLDRGARLLEPDAASRVQNAVGALQGVVASATVELERLTADAESL